MPNVSRKISQIWQNLSFQAKLFILLLTGAVVPVILATHSIVLVTEDFLLKSQENLLQKELLYFKEHLERVKEDYNTAAETLQKSVELIGIDLDDPAVVTSKSQVLHTLVRELVNTKFRPSFYALTDTEGRTVAQNIQVLADLEESENLLNPHIAPCAPKYRQVSLPVGINLSELPIVKDSIKQQRGLSGFELISTDLLKKLGLATQANIGYRAQKIENLPESKQPLAIGTYNTDGGQIGMLLIAVQPIKYNHRLVGLAIVGQLLNRDPQLVDDVTYGTGVATATIFAYDWRISVNVPNYSGKRALGTRVAREVAITALNQGKIFIGKTSVIGIPYRAAYHPIYDHQYHLHPLDAKPIGIYAVAEPETNIQKTLFTLAITGYGIGCGILCLTCIVALVIAKTFSSSIQRITEFAQLIGRGEQGIRLEEHRRQDEIGILERELNKMTIRIERNLEKVLAKELQIREQAQQLENALQQLQQTQAQIIESAKMASLEQLVAGVAHEINNPVNFIYANIGYAEEYLQNLISLLRLYQDHYPQTVGEIETASIEMDWEFVANDSPKLFQSMKKGAERIRQIVLLLKMFSRIDEAERKLVSLHDSIDSILELLQYRLQPTDHRPGIEVIREYGKLPLVDCYAGQLNQVFLSIITNAIDAIQDSPQISGLPWIRICTEQINADYVTIRIIDNGPGITENIKSRLFDPFFTTKPVGQGMGMGLAISYQVITQRHGGVLECISQPNEGTEFVITIPLQLSHSS